MQSDSQGEPLDGTRIPAVTQENIETNRKRQRDQNAEQHDPL
jgi:hypothetical protein